MQKGPVVRLLKRRRFWTSGAVPALVVRGERARSFLSREVDDCIMPIDYPCVFYRRDQSPFAHTWTGRLPSTPLAVGLAKLVIAKPLLTGGQ